MTHYEHNGEDERQAARRTAHALGQTTDAERSAVAAELAASPQARQEVGEIETLAARLKDAARLAPRPAHSPELRQAIEERLAQLVPAAGRAAAIDSAARPTGQRWSRRLASLAVTAFLVALTVLIGLYGANRHRDVAMSPSAKDFSTTGATLGRSFLERAPADRTTGDQTGHFDIIPSLPLHNDRGEEQTGRVMFGVGVNSDSGLVGKITLDETRFGPSGINGQGTPRPSGGIYGSSGNDVWGDGSSVTSTRPVGTGALTKTGAGTVVLSGANTYMGGMLYLGYHTAFSDGVVPRMDYDIDPIKYDVGGRAGSGQTFDSPGSADLFTSDLSIASNRGVGTGGAGYAGFAAYGPSGLTQVSGAKGTTNSTVPNSCGSYPLIVYALIQDPKGTTDVTFGAGGIGLGGLGRVGTGENFHRFPMSGSPANGDGKSDVLAETSGPGMSQFDGVPIVGRVQRQSGTYAGTTIVNVGSPIIYPDPETVTFNNLGDNYDINGSSLDVIGLAVRGRSTGDGNGGGQVEHYFHTPYDNISRYHEPAEGLAEAGRGNVQTFTFQRNDSTTTDTTQNGIVNQAQNLFNNNSNRATTAHSGVIVSLSGAANYTGGTVVTGGKLRLNNDVTLLPLYSDVVNLNSLTGKFALEMAYSGNGGDEGQIVAGGAISGSGSVVSVVSANNSPGFNFNNGADLGNSGLGRALHPLDVASQNPPTTTGLFTSDLSIPFSQGSYASGVPQLSGFDATAGATGDSGQGIADGDGERRVAAPACCEPLTTINGLVRGSNIVPPACCEPLAPINGTVQGVNFGPSSADYAILSEQVQKVETDYRAVQQSTAEEINRIAAQMKMIKAEEQQRGERTAGIRVLTQGQETQTIGALTSPATVQEEFRKAQAALVASRYVIDAKPAQGIRIAPKIPIESWKPARVVPNSSRLMVGDREELPIKGMQVDVRVDGFRARVLIDLYYFNDRPQQLEGNFQLRLPDEASPYFFAFGRTVYQAPQVTANDSMFFKPQQVSQGDTTPEKILALRGNSWEEPKVARMVPKEKAALAYRDTVRRRVDPALVEWSGAGVFQCRVFPLAPQSLHRVTVGYDVDLTRVGDDLELRLDLPGQAPATIVDLNIAASDARQVSLDAPATALTPGPSPEYGRGEKFAPATLTPGPFPGGRGEKFAPATALAPGPSPGGRGETTRLSYRLVDPKERPLMVRLRKPGMQMLTGNDEATGSFFATRAALTLPKTPAEVRSTQAVFLVDTSLSAGPQFPLWNKLLRATLENNRDQIKQFAVLFFNVETFWWQEKFVANTPENVEALMNYADGLALEGATDLGGALKEAAAPKWQQAGEGPAPDLFLLSDGAATWGEDRWPLLAAELKMHANSNQTALTPGPSPATMLRTVPGEVSPLTPGLA